MKNRNREHFLETLFNFKTAWGRDIFQIDAAKCWGKMDDSLNNFFCVLRIQTDRNSIDTAKFLKQHTFSFHHRHCGQRSNIAKSKHSASIRDHGNSIGFHSVYISIFWIFCDKFARFCYARCIGNRQIFSGFYGRFCNSFQFPMPFFM